MVITNEKTEPKKQQKEKHKTEKAKIIASFSLGLLWFILLTLTLTTDPIIMMLRYFTQVTKGSFIEELMLREIEGIHVSAYLFNITNAQEFMEGEDEKLKVEEVGPFTYREFRANKDIDIDTEAKVIRYTPKVRMEFVPEESVGDPHKINVTVPNIPMLGLASKLGDYPYFTRVGFNIFANQVNSKAVVSLHAHDYLWGYEEPLVSLAHTIMPGSMKFDKMGFLDRIYDPTRRTRIEVSIADENKFMVKSVDGYKRLRMGESIDPDTCSVCNTFENVYEGVGFPLQITKDFPIRIFRNGLCRILDLEYETTKPTSYGAESFVYRFSDNFFNLEPNQTSNGLIKLPDCFYDMPMAFSKPHFLDTDPSLYERIEGIKPDNKTKGWVTIDPRLGLTLETVVSLQINLVVGDVSDNTQGKRFSNMVLPVCYLHIVQPPLPEESMIFINGVYYTGPYILLGIKILLLILILVCWVYCARLIHLYYKKKSDIVKSLSLEGTLDEVNANNIEPLMRDVPKDDS